MLTNHIRKHIHIYLVVLLALISGSIVGAWQATCLESSGDQALYSSISESFDSANFDYKQSVSKFISSTYSNILCVVIMWAFGITFIGIIPISIYLFIRGASIGFTVGFLFKSFGQKGLLVSLISILPAYLVFIPCMIFLAVFCATFSAKLFENARSEKKAILISYSLVAVIILIIMELGSLIWAFSPYYLIK